MMNPGARPVILLIDDEKEFCEVIARSLVKRGFEVRAASDGAEGLRSAAESPPDLILCDVVMPQMNGHEVLAALRRHDRLADIPVIFLTGQGEPGDVRQGMNLGADDYLAKPANIADLLGAIKARLDRRQLLQRVRERLAGNATAGSPADARLADSFLVKTSTQQRLVKISEIKTILAYGEYSWVYCDNSQKGALLRKSLKRWQSELPGGQFIRVHRRAIVNLAFMERIERLPTGRLQVRLRDIVEPISVSLSQTPVLNRKLKTLRG